LRTFLVPIYHQLGRIDEAQQILKDRWDDLNEAGQGASEPAINLVLLHIELGLKTTPVENVRALLDQAARAAPDDDRVWLGRANLAIRTGRYDEAKRWLDACQQQRPDDVPVWRARLNWGLATNRLEVVQQALKHLPAEEPTSAQFYRLNAWLSSHRGDFESERRELERLLDANPADLPALDRLAQQAQKDGRTARADELFLPFRARKILIARICGAGSDSLGQGLLYCVDEDVDLIERRINIGGDSDALELGMLGRRGDNPLLVPEVTEKLAGVDALNLYERDSA
jgi:tetratricopeptide (TPR) repeat protein